MIRKRGQGRTSCQGRYLRNRSYYCYCRSVPKAPTIKATRNSCSWQDWYLLPVQSLTITTPAVCLVRNSYKPPFLQKSFFLFKINLNATKFNLIFLRWFGKIGLWFYIDIYVLTFEYVRNLEVKYAK